jgi:hypothetical protein
MSIKIMEIGEGFVIETATGLLPGHYKDEKAAR